MERSILALLILLLPLHGTAQSISVGTPRRGHLQNGAELALSGEGWGVLPKTRKRDYRYGIPSLIQLIQDLGSYSVKEHQTQLFVGNLSGKEGRYSQSRSHNSGRDADFAFPMKSSVHHSPVVPRDYIRCLGDLTGTNENTYLDLPVLTSWIRYILEYPDVEVGWIFLANPIRNAILLELESSPPGLQLKAATVLRQPSDSAPHDDHIHVRLFCPPETLPQCVDGQPRWLWNTDTSVPSPRHHSNNRTGER